MDVVQIRLSELKRPKRNVRMHSQKQIDEYCRSVKKYGQIRPMVIDENNVILVGNGLYETLIALGWETGACVVKSDLSENEKKKLMLADNRIFSLGVDDMAAFDEIIAELAGDFDVPGYDDNLLNSLIANASEVDEIMSGYGIISETAKETMKKASEQYKRNDEAFTEAAEEHKPVQPPTYNREEGAENANSGVSTQEVKVTPTTEESPLETPPVPLQRRFIICPKCGEKIWL